MIKTKEGGLGFKKNMRASVSAAVCGAVAGFGLLAGAETSVSVDVGAPLLATTSRAFLGVNIDSASLFQGARLDVEDADLVELSTRLGRRT